MIDSVQFIKHLRWIKFFVVFIASFVLSYYLCRTYFYVNVPNPPFQNNETSITSSTSFSRLNFSKVIDLQSIFPPILINIFPKLHKSKFCFSNNAYYKVPSNIPISQSLKEESDKIGEMSFLVSQDGHSEQLSAKVGETNCIWILNNTIDSISVGSAKYKPLESTSSLTGLKSTFQPDISKSNFYIWPGMYNLISLTIILFLFITITITVLQDIWHFYVKSKDRV